MFESHGSRRVRRLVPTLLLMLAVAIMVPSIACAKFTVKDKVGEEDIKLQVYGFSQFEVRGGEGYTGESDGMRFQAQRVRVGFNYSDRIIKGKLFLDFNQSFTKDEGGLPKVIKDAFLAHKFSNGAFLRMGMIKTPVGMGFTVPGWNLDIIERQAMDKGLVLERDFGVMLSGRLIGQDSYEGKKQMECSGLEMGTEKQGYGFGYDIGIFNPAGRSGAVTWDKAIINDAKAYAGRLHYDYGPALHLEASYGVSEQAGGAVRDDDGNILEDEVTEDYSVMGFGAASELWEQGLELKFEYLAGANVKGVDGYDQNAFSVMAGYYVVPNFQLVAKTYQAKAEKMDTDSVSLSNTYVGFNWSPSPLSTKWRNLQRFKIVVNYVIAGGDKDEWYGVGGLKENGWAVGCQYKY